MVAANEQNNITYVSILHSIRNALKYRDKAITSGKGYYTGLNSRLRVLHTFLGYLNMERVWRANLVIGVEV